MIPEVITVSIFLAIFATIGINMGENWLDQRLDENQFLKTATCEELDLFITDHLRNNTKIEHERAQGIFDKECEN